MTDIEQLHFLLGYLEGLTLKAKIVPSDISVVANVVENNKFFRMTLIEKLKQVNIQRNQLGTIIDGVHRDLFIFLEGPTFFQERPESCTYDFQFPGTYYTVLKSYDKDKIILTGVYRSKRYLCKSRSSSISLAKRIKEDTGLKIISYLNSEDKYSADPYEDSRQGFKDAMEGNSENIWNID